MIPVSKAADNVRRATETTHKVYKRYVEGMQTLQLPMVFFNNRSPLGYWAEGRLRFNVYLPQRKKNSKEWRTLYRSAVIRNKCLGIIAHVLGIMPSPSIQAQNENQAEDVMAAKFFKDMVEFSMEHEGMDIKLFWALVTAVAEGTVILKDDYGKFERKIKEITHVDEETGKVRWTEKTIEEFCGAFTEVVANDEILPADPFVSDIQKQPWLIRRKRMPYDIAKAKYGHYANFKDVKPGMPQNWIYSSDYFQPYSTVVYLAQNQVEVIEYWEQEGDHYDIVMNGVQLTEDDNPNPRHDKKLPFAKSGWEPIDNNFFWYKGAPDKLSPEADVYDSTLRMAIDAQHLNLIKPLATNNPALVNEDIIVPGNVVYVGEMENNRVEPVMGTTNLGFDTGTANILSTMMTNVSSSSLDPMQMGQAPVGQTPTATQAVQQAQNAKVMLGLFGWMYGYLITEWTKLRCQTLLWEVAKQVDLKKITLADRILDSGKTGSRTYIMESGLAKYGDGKKLEMSRKMSMLEREGEGKEEIVGLDPEELSKLTYYIKLDSAPQPKRTDSLMQSLAAEKWAVKATAPQIWNLNYAARQLALAWGEDEDEALNKENLGSPMADMQAQAGAAQQGNPAQSQGPSLMSQLKGGAVSQTTGAPTNVPQMAA